jgi:hypothetical protein
MSHRGGPSNPNLSATVCVTPPRARHWGRARMPRALRSVPFSAPESAGESGLGILRRGTLLSLRNGKASIEKAHTSGTSRSYFRSIIDLFDRLCREALLQFGRPHRDLRSCFSAARTVDRSILLVVRLSIDVRLPYSKDALKMSRWSQSELCCCSLMPSRRMKASEPQVPGPKNGHGNQNSLRVHSESLIKNWGLISRRRRAWNRPAH